MTDGKPIAVGKVPGLRHRYCRHGRDSAVPYRQQHHLRARHAPYPELLCLHSFIIPSLPYDNVAQLRHRHFHTLSPPAYTCSGAEASNNAPRVYP